MKTIPQITKRFKQNNLDSELDITETNGKLELRISKLHLLKNIAASTNLHELMEQIGKDFDINSLKDPDAVLFFFQSSFKGKALTYPNPREAFSISSEPQGPDHFVITIKANQLFDQRRSKRHPLKKQIRCSSIDGTIGQVIDVSATGFQVLSKSKVTINQRLVTSIDFMAPIPKIHTEAECVWKKYDEDLGMYNCGYRMLEPLDESLLETAVQNLDATHA